MEFSSTFSAFYLAELRFIKRILSRFSSYRIDNFRFVCPFCVDFLVSELEIGIEIAIGFRLGLVKCSTGR